MFHGSKETRFIDIEVTLRIGNVDHYDYQFKPNHGNNDRLSFAHELYGLRNFEHDIEHLYQFESSNGGLEAGLASVSRATRQATLDSNVAKNIVLLLGGIGVFQFHDTSKDSGFKKPCDYEDNRRLASDGRNLAAVLFRSARTSIVSS